MNDGVHPRDRGSGTIWTLALIGVIWSVATVAMVVGGVRAARHRAYAAADLAALAAASHAVQGSAAACRLAADVARGSGGHVRRCAMHGRVCDILVAVIVQVPVAGRLQAVARARAGPAAPDVAPANQPAPDPAPLRPRL